ncbi:MAG: hypothetical protein U1F83_18540 [Verrucomicrobiota bacterium]
MKHTLKTIFGIIAVFVGMGFVMPAVAQWQHEGAMTNSSIVLCLLGAVLTLAGIGGAILGVTRRNARQLAGTRSNAYPAPEKS